MMPLFSVMKAGERLIRLFDPDSYGATPTGFRSWGPIHRFDHHRGESGDPSKQSYDPERFVYYAALSLSGGVVEVFGDAGWIASGTHVYVAQPHLLRDLTLLDLRREGAMRCGSVAALSKVADRSCSQAWSRYFYESNVIGEVDGVLYSNAHNDEDAVILYERSSDALECPANRVIRLMDTRIQPRVMEIMLQHNILLL